MSDGYFNTMMTNINNLRSLEASVISGIGRVTGELRDLQREMDRLQLDALREQERALRTVMACYSEAERFDSKSA